MGGVVDTEKGHLEGAFRARTYSGGRQPRMRDVCMSPYAGHVPRASLHIQSIARHVPCAPRATGSMNSYYAGAHQNHTPIPTSSAVSTIADSKRAYSMNPNKNYTISPLLHLMHLVYYQYQVQPFIFRLF